MVKTSNATSGLARFDHFRSCAVIGNITKLLFAHGFLLTMTKKHMLNLKHFRNSTFRVLRNQISVADISEMVQDRDNRKALLQRNSPLPFRMVSSSLTSSEHERSN